MHPRATRCVLSLLIASGAAACADEVATYDPWDLDGLEAEPEPGPQPEPEPEPEPEPDRDPRFLGTWMVHDNVARGGITADVYRFVEGGAMELVERYDPAGVVVQCDPDAGADACSRWGEGLRCDFGERWESAGAETLRIEGACSDGAARVIELAFPASDAGDATYPGVEARLASVDGEREGWFASTFLGPGPSFFFVRCTDGEPNDCWLP